MYEEPLSNLSPTEQDPKRAIDVPLHEEEDKVDSSRLEEARDDKINRVTDCISENSEKDNSSTENQLNEENSEESSPTVTYNKNDEVHSTRSLLESLDLEVPSSYEVEPVDFPKNPFFSLPSGVHQFSDDEEEEEEEENKSVFQAQLLSNCQDVRLSKVISDEKSSRKKKVIPVNHDIFMESRCDESSLDGSHTSFDDQDLDTYLDSPDEFEDSILERLGQEDIEPIPELSAEEEIREARCWKPCVIGGIERNIDLKVLEPYKRVVSHGGYLSQGSHNAIIVFSACFLPDRSRYDYDYVMNNLFMYVIATLDQLVTDDYVLIYLHGATSRSCMPKFQWLKQCYQMIDHKLRKNLKGLYLVHPTFWLKTLVIMTKPFVSSKFSKKLFFIYSLNELFRTIPLEQASIPDRVKKYDELKQALEKGY